LLAPVGTLDWQYHQHAPMITGSGNLVLFDNGNFGASPFDGNTPMNGPSRAVEFAINETTMEITQVWDFGFSPDPEAYSDRIGDADWMPQTGNVLLNYGSTTSIDGSTSASLGLGPYHARIVEVDDGFPAQIVFEMSVYKPVPGLRIYRVERIPTLYPVTGPSWTPVPGLSAASVLLLAGLIAASGFALRFDRRGRAHA
jgi:arylsulfate sulfotransferase